MIVGHPETTCAGAIFKNCCMKYDSDLESTHRCIADSFQSVGHNVGSDLHTALVRFLQVILSTSRSVQWHLQRLHHSHTIQGRRVIDLIPLGQFPGLLALVTASTPTLECSREYAYDKMHIQLTGLT